MGWTQQTSKVVGSETKVWVEIRNESVPIQLAQCWFPGLVISSAKILVYFRNKIYVNNFIKQHSETFMF